MICDVQKKVQLKWAFRLNRNLITEPFFRDFFSIIILRKSPIEMDFSPEPRFYYRTNFFATFFSIVICDVYKKVKLKWTFRLNSEFITEPFFRDFFSIMILQKSPIEMDFRDRN